MDFYLVNEANTIIAGSFDDNVNRDAVEVLSFEAPYTGRYGLVIALFSGPPPTYMKWIATRAPTSVQYETRSSTIFSHQNSAGAGSTGAAFFQNTPRFGVSPARQESFSSAGGTPIFFNNNGERLAVPQDRMKPDFVGPDGGITTCCLPLSQPLVMMILLLSYLT